MEVREQRVDDLKVESGIDEDRRFPIPWHDLACVERGVLQRPGGRRADGNHPPSLALGILDRASYGGADRVALGIDDVILDGFAAHWLERAITDVQRHL